jgi:hypothetical protein
MSLVLKTSMRSARRRHLQPVKILTLQTWSIAAATLGVREPMVWWSANAQHPQQRTQDRLSCCAGIHVPLRNLSHHPVGKPHTLKDGNSLFVKAAKAELLRPKGLALRARAAGATDLRWTHHHAKHDLDKAMCSGLEQLAF